MAENLNIGTLITGTSQQSDNGIIEKYCYSDSETICDNYGGLYLWDEMMQYSTTEGVQGICPTSWHLPSYFEWTTLTNFLGGVSIAGRDMKESGTAHWLTPNSGATNSSGFTAFPGGFRANNFLFYDIWAIGYFWSSTQDDGTNSWHRRLYYDTGNVARKTFRKVDGYSVRCVINN